MKNHWKSVVWLITLALLLSACGPTAEQIATMTAAAWTPTPLPTPTPPPPPFDLTVSVVDEAGAPIAGASIVFPESGDGTPVAADEQGQYDWLNLPAELVTLNVSAQGYLPGSTSQTIVRGPNTISVALRRDPFGILAAEACPSGQNVLYIEDFQDGQAQDWPQIEAGLRGDMPNGWGIVDEAGNKILLHANAPSPMNDELENKAFNNFVWRAKFKAAGNDADMFFMWRISHPEEGMRKRYVVVFTAKEKPWMVRLLDSPSSPMSMNTGTAVKGMKQDQWYDIVIAYYEGLHQVWYDGILQISYQDPQPYPEGTIGFEMHLETGKTTQFFVDDLVICELTAPYEPLQ